MLRNLFFSFLLLCAVSSAQTSRLKYVVYDFDGLDLGQSDLPDGDYKNNGLFHSIAASPLPASDVIGDRVLKLDLDWQATLGEFGKATMRFIDLNAAEDRLNFFIYNPLSNSADADLQVVLTEDDNGDDVYQGNLDDKWVRSVVVARSAGWQLISLPLSGFTDDNGGGNGSFDAKYGSPGGMLFSVGIIFKKPAGADGGDEYYLDMLCFTEGAFPAGNTPLDLPPAAPGTRCVLGALSNGDPSQVPGDIEGFLPPGKKLALVNWFLYYSTSGTTPNVFPGQEVQTLIDNGYTPIITWESMFAQYTRLDAVQPRLSNILAGDYDGYIDAFANKIKSYSGTVILRILHEFEGDWYSWSLAQNGQDPEKYKSAWRHIVDRFRAAGAGNVQWMWCLNAEPKPYAAFNNVVAAYPGDSYVDIVATDIYNHPDLGTPPWKSFRYTMAESYYHLVKHFSHKPIYVCEVGSRERNGSEPSSSQNKAGWTCMMSKDLKSYFNRVQALVYFSTVKEHDWRINSTESAKQAFIDCIWSDSYYGGVVSVEERKSEGDYYPWPNPFTDHLYLQANGVRDSGGSVVVTLYDVSGKLLIEQQAELLPEQVEIGPDLSPGIYILQVRRNGETQRHKLVRTYDR